jgi:hypothetical protein
MNIVHKTSFPSYIAGEKVNADLYIFDTHEADIKFTLSRKKYTFKLFKWNTRGMTEFLKLFFGYTNREGHIFGNFNPITDEINDFNMTTEQKINAIVQAAGDVMSCVDLITTKCKLSVLDYAVWYKYEYANDYKICNYEDYITDMACECIIQCHFLAPCTSFEVVRFQPYH